MKPILVQSLPSDPSLWLYEIKFDGFRVIALKSGEAVELWSASHKPLDFPAIARAVAALPCREGIFDGEVVALDPDGRTSFQLLQNSQDARTDTPICLYLFDLLELNGKDLRRLGTARRKEQLATLLARSSSDGQIRFSANLDGDPALILDAVRQLGLEGIVAKGREAPYQPGTRSPLWQKLKLVAEHDFVIGGYTAPEGTRRYFGALIVGYFRKDEFVFVARVGSGFSSADLERFHRMFQPLKRATCPFVNLPNRQAGRWGQGITAAK